VAAAIADVTMRGKKTKVGFMATAAVRISPEKLLLV